MKLPILKAATRAHYAEVLDNHVLPALGDYYLDAITTDDLATLRDAMTSKGARPATVNSRMRVLKTILRDAIQDKDLPRDPTRRVPALREVRGEEDRNCLGAAELQAFLVAARRLTPQWHVFFSVLAFTGMRFGEATALKWADVDEANFKIVIRRAQWKGKVDTTKTGVIRSVPLSSELVDILRAHRITQRARDLTRRRRERVTTITTARDEADGWVFPGRAGKLMHNTAPRKALAKCLVAAGVEHTLTVHGFRRTFNNLVRQVTAGEVVRAMTGHASEDMTEHYSHVGLEEKRAAISGLVHLVSSASRAVGNTVGNGAVPASDPKNTRENP